MSFATGMEGSVLLLPWFRQDHEEYEASFLVPWPWFCWGYITRRGSKVGWYILVSLPSYVMQRPWHQPLWGEPTWHQRVLIYKERLQVPKYEQGDGWMMTEWECQQ